MVPRAVAFTIVWPGGCYLRIHHDVTMCNSYCWSGNRCSIGQPLDRLGPDATVTVDLAVLRKKSIRR